MDAAPERGGPRVVHYLGGKGRLVDRLAALVSEVAPAPGRACDLFAGTGTVARGLAVERPVVAADVQEYACVLTRAATAPVRLTPGRIHEVVARAEERVERDVRGPASELLRLEDEAIDAASVGTTGSLDRIVEHGAPVRHRGGPLWDGALPDLLHRLDRHAGVGAVLRLYGGSYFGYRQAIWLDALLEQAAESGRTERDQLLAAVMGAASEAVASVGNHFAQPLRLRTASGADKPAALRSVLKARSRSVVDLFVDRALALAATPGSPFDVEVARGDYRDVLDALPRDVAVVYADPPYTRDHYSRFYHVLETIALADEPELSRLPGSSTPSRGLYRTDRHQSPFSIRSAAPGAFDALFRGVAERRIPLVLSYSPLGEGTVSRPVTRVMDLDDLLAAARRYFQHVQVRPIDDVVHSKFNAAHRNAHRSSGTESVLIAT